MCKKFPELTEILNPEKSHKAYNDVIKSKPRPGIPYFKFYGQKLTHISKMPNEVEGENGGNLINFDKWRRLSTIIQEIQLFQDKTYPIKENPELLAYLAAFGQTG
mmetsp:Transcript_6189/g.9646  ORF Transcript_6189/g.9646 Transcript_6189/m.9646 type:complete len:105 (+) Transcript_6189:157-471(+)